MKTFDLTSKSVREFADRIVTAHPELDKPKALEIASHGFGFRNFDTLSSVLKEPSTRAKSPTLKVELKKPVTLWIEGYVCDNEAATFDWLKVNLTSTFIERLLTRRNLCSTNGLLHVSEDSRPADWYRDEYVGVIHDWQLYVSPYRFWFRGHPKHASYAVESRAVHFDKLLELLKTPSDEDESFKWIKGDLYKDSSLAESVYETVHGDSHEEELGWVAPASKEAALQRLEDLELSLHEGLDDETRADILDEIAYLEDWLESNT